MTNDSKKEIIIAFTWRARFRNLSPKEIIDSEYINAITWMVTDERIIAVTNELGYEIKIKLHPNVSPYYDLLPESITSKVSDYSYNKIFAESAMMITDYSSTVFDLAYLKKPIIYYQYDKGEYFNNPYTAPSDFDYEAEGFGPVAYDFESFVTEFEKIIRSNCQMDSLYKDKVDAFFAYRDRNNCERVYKKIKELL